jgi:hypothetical protein
MRDFICGEVYIWVCVESLGDEVSEGVILLVEGEDGCVWNAYVPLLVGNQMKSWRILTGIELVCYFLLALFLVEYEELVSIGDVNSVRSVQAHIAACGGIGREM